MYRADEVNAFTKRISCEMQTGKRRSCPSLSLFLLLSDTPAVRRTVNASCCWPALAVKKKKCAVRCSLTVHVRVIPVAEHRPVGQDLEVMSAIHAVEPGEPPAAERQAALHGPLLGHTLLLIRHAPGRKGGQQGDLQRSSAVSTALIGGLCISLQWSGAWHARGRAHRKLGGRARLLALASPNKVSWMIPETSTF